MKRVTGPSARGETAQHGGKTGDGREAGLRSGTLEQPRSRPPAGLTSAPLPSHCLVHPFFFPFLPVFFTTGLASPAVEAGLGAPKLKENL